MHSEAEQGVVEREQGHSVVLEQGHRRRRVDPVLFEYDVPDQAGGKQPFGALQNGVFVTLDVDLEELNLAIGQERVEPLYRYLEISGNPALAGITKGREPHVVFEVGSHREATIPRLVRNREPVRCDRCDRGVVVPARDISLENVEEQRVGLEPDHGSRGACPGSHQVHQIAHVRTDVDDEATRVQ